MQNRRIARSLCALAASAGISTAASAGLPYGMGVPITVPSDNVTITLVFDHTAADFTGNLYFLGTGDATSVLNPAPNSDATNQGYFVVNNHTSVLGSMVVLPGVFNAGQVLHFAYDIVAPFNASTAVLRTDVAGDRNQFAWDTENSFFAIEDIYLDNPQCDEDYNDIVIGVCFNPVPGAGALAMFGVAGLAGGRRRRK
jgi:MYXO-CTERM domain-containing protein